LTLSVRQVRLERRPADHRTIALGRCRVDLRGVHLTEQIGVAIEERAIDDTLISVPLVLAVLMALTTR
jgi:hypothetical protein